MEGTAARQMNYSSSPPPPPPLSSGHRFCPSDAELCSILRKKITEGCVEHDIRHVDIYTLDPQTFSERNRPLNDRENEWYFFATMKRKHGNGRVFDRVVEGGFWQTSIGDKEILDAGKRVVGLKKTLVFHLGKKDKTDWILYEYRIDTIDKQTEEFVLCQMHKKRKARSPSKSQTNIEEDKKEIVEKSNNDSVHHVDQVEEGCSSSYAVSGVAGEELEFEELVSDIENQLLEEDDSSEAGAVSGKEQELKKLLSDIENQLLEDDNSSEAGVSCEEQEMKEFASDIENLLEEADSPEANIDAAVGNMISSGEIQTIRDDNLPPRIWGDDEFFSGVEQEALKKFPASWSSCYEGLNDITDYDGIDEPPRKRMCPLPNYAFMF